MNAAAAVSASEASFSSDGCYRWFLRRRLATDGGCLIYIGLNPSRADGQRDDPTLRRLIGFTRQWGYQELVVLNLFARMSPSPAALLRVKDPIGVLNNVILNRWLHQWSRTSGLDLWCGWGVNGARWDRDQVVLEAILRLLPERRRSVPDSPHPLMLGRTASGQPRHPLYAPRQACLHPFLWADPEPIRHPVRTLKDVLPN
ncbi:hypothetical protein KR52_13790 [Synechococcus sp. KORDI-52]|uniref:DUF1643 domain-containing protein n=1 Tax=Synechococcus sp. KORDI-52 TaxID=585425 RepID=UPI0004E076EE|nr:DUF1643 domain-containing protein [Synechococcus sp. KORDI-52]AII50194.1 hypothetical protein KR52_13790 [Synechococcus sp. KORDI-52]